MKNLLLCFCLLRAVSLSAQTSDAVFASTPEGWEYPDTPYGIPEIYRLYRLPDSGQAVMEIYSHKNAAILAKNISLPLGDDTRIAWSWRVDRLPSPVAEDSATTHDYISVAVLFDNGQDISYVWSRELSNDTGFRCPLPDWTARETHVVVRSGERDLYQWLREGRNLKADYEKYIGGDIPANIAQVWLITVSAFQDGTAKATVKDIAIDSPLTGKLWQVL